jgi:SNF2 family DNA or RNA helicase
MIIKREDNLFCFYETPFELRERFVRAGLAWDRQRKAWVTPFVEYANKAYALAGDASAIARRDEALSSAFTSANVHHISLFPFQQAGVDYITHRPATLVGDEPGLGKTAQAIVSCDVLGVKTILVVCPASLKINWRREFTKFGTLPRTFGIATGSSFPIDAQVVIINYDILQKHHHALRSKTWDMIILDEAHFIKEGSSIRSKEVVGVKGVDPIRGRRKLALTGTPILNRPIELYNLLKFLCPYAFTNKHKFALKYCDAKLGPFGWDYSGASRLEELQQMLRGSFLLRREKKDVLTQLPPKTYQVIELDPDANMKRILKKEKELFGFLGCKPELADEEYVDIVKKLKNPKTGFGEMATIRRENGMAKVNMVIDHIKEVLDEGQEKVVVFAHHREVIRSLSDAFRDICVVLDGSTAIDARQSAVDRFQQDKNIRVFIGQLTAAGTGITLSKSRRVIFAEFDWVPGINEQAADRCHRIGQKENVLIQYLVIDGSIDAAIAKTFVKKQEVIERATNRTDEQKIQELLK